MLVAIEDRRSTTGRGPDPGEAVARHDVHAPRFGASDRLDVGLLEPDLVGQVRRAVRTPRLRHRLVEEVGEPVAVRQLALHLAGGATSALIAKLED